MRFASEHEYTIFKILRWSRAPEIKLLGLIYSLRYSNYLESALLFKSYAGINETIISVSFKKNYKSFIDDINKYMETGGTFSHASINQE